jgi:hypothetical protein
MENMNGNSIERIGKYPIRPSIYGKYQCELHR